MLSLLLTALLNGNAETMDLGEPAKGAAMESSGESLLREAKTLRYAQRWYEAAQKYRSYIAQYPGSGRIADARFWLAATLEQNQQWDEASKAYSEFLNLHPDQRLLGREAKLNRIHCWGMRKGQSEDAIPGLAAALSDSTDEVQVAAALELAQCKDFRALPALKKGLALPTYADACGLALLSLGVKPEAASQHVRFLVIRIKESGKPEVVTIRLALALARAVGNYLSDAQVQQAKIKGYDLENLMDQAGKLPKGSLLFSVEDKNSSVTINVE